MKTLLLAIALCLLFKQDAARLLEQKCNSSSRPPKPIEDNANRKGRITKGTDAEREPWMAAIYHIKKFICGGTLITSQFVLTAAHCIQPKEEMYVTLGVYNITSYTPRLEVEATFVHPSYSPADQDYLNDIALIQLKNEVTFTAMISPICISLEMDFMALQVETMDKIEAFGWGYTEKRIVSDILQTVTLDRFDREICEKEFNITGKMDRRQMCAGTNDNKGDTCTGDSGGPLVRKFITKNNKNIAVPVQLGIVSYGNETCRGIGVYTNVIKYVDWIEYIVTGDSDNDQEEITTTRVVVPQQQQQAATTTTHSPPITGPLITDSAWFLDNDCGEYDRKKFPFTVDIFGPTFTAKGTIIARDFVLTNDKNILLDLKADQLEVALLNPLGIYEEISVNRVQRSNGLALLYLKYPLTVSVKPICLMVDKKIRNDIYVGTFFYANEDEQYKLLSSNECASIIGRYDPQSEVCVSFPRDNLEVYPRTGEPFGTWLSLENGSFKYIFAGMASSYTNGVQVLTDVVANTDWILNTMRTMNATDEDLLS